MICLNCGRPNPSGTSLCTRCRERRPGLERARGGVIYQRTRETARVRNRGSGILVVGVLLLAGLIFAGGTLAVLLAPGDPPPTNPGSAFNPNPTPTRLQIFEQFTPTPVPPTATPWFPSFTPGSPTDFGSFFPSPSGFVTLPPPTSPGAATPRPTRPPTPRPTPTGTPTSGPTPTPDSAPRARFNSTQQGSSRTVQFNGNNSTNAQSWSWDFNGEGTAIGPTPSFEFATYGPKSVTLTVTDADGDEHSLTKTIRVQAPDCDADGNPPGCNPTPSPPTDPPPSVPVEPPPA